MINWFHMEEGYCEGSFISEFFCDDENGNELTVCAKSPELSECAEKCVEAFNSLSKEEIREICVKIADSIKESGMDEEIESDDLENPLDILNYCWFVTLYVNMLSREDEISYVIEGEGEWGSLISFVIDNGKLVYVGEDYFDFMKNENEVY